MSVSSMLVHPCFLLCLSATRHPIGSHFRAMLHLTHSLQSEAPSPPLSTPNPTRSWFGEQPHPLVVSPFWFVEPLCVCARERLFVSVRACVSVFVICDVDYVDDVDRQCFGFVATLAVLSFSDNLYPQ